MPLPPATGQLRNPRPAAFWTSAQKRPEELDALLELKRPVTQESVHQVLAHVAPRWQAERDTPLRILQSLSRASRSSQLALEVLTWMRSNGCPYDARTAVAGMTACEMRGKWQLALDMLRELPALQVKADAACYSKCMACCEGGRNWPKALALLREMPEARLQPDEVTYNVAIQACKSARIGRELFQEALRKRLYAANMRSPELLDLHGMSPWAAVHAVRWWMRDVLPTRFANDGVRGRFQRFYIQTGIGNHRSTWALTDVRAAIMALLNSMGLRLSLDGSNEGNFIVVGEDLRRILPLRHEDG